MKSQQLPSLGTPASSRQTITPGAFAIIDAFARTGLLAGSRRPQDFSRTLPVHGRVGGGEGHAMC
ncbi:MAG: hypothetical protein M3Y74_03310 [Chloroflexota bacterium]|nr:hypothetical protein [Chloroflexota bacterium]